MLSFGMSLFYSAICYSRFVTLTMMLFLKSLMIECPAWLVFWRFNYRLVGDFSASCYSVLVPFFYLSFCIVIFCRANTFDLVNSLLLSRIFSRSSSMPFVSFSIAIFDPLFSWPSWTSVFLFWICSFFSIFIWKI